MKLSNFIAELSFMFSHGFYVIKRLCPLFLHCILIAGVTGIYNLSSAQTLPQCPSDHGWRFGIPEDIGQVKQVTVTRHSVHEEGDSLKISGLRRYSFRENGTISKIESYDPETNELTFERFFDEFGRFHSVNTVRKRYVEVICSYDDDQRIIEKMTYPLGSSDYPLKIIFHYDEHWLKPKATYRYKDNEVLTDSTLYTYDFKGNLEFEIFYNTPQGFGLTLDSSFTGGEEVFDPLPNDTTRYEYKYSSDGYMLEKTEYRRGEPRKKFIYTNRGDTTITTEKQYRKFDDEKWQVKEVTRKIEDTTIQTIYLHDFDDIQYIYYQGRVESENRLRDDVITDTVVYRYETIEDEKGHWVEQKKFRNDRLIEIINRDIVYLN